MADCHQKAAFEAEVQRWRQNRRASSRDKAFLIAISGCTNGGKTTVTRLLAEALIEGNHRVKVIPQDDYYFADNDVSGDGKKIDPLAENEKGDVHVSDYSDYDSLHAIDLKGFISAINNAAEDHDFVLVDGHLITEMRDVFEMMDLVVFFTLDFATCKRRRASRKDYNPPDTPCYFDQVVWPSFESHLKNALLLARDSNILRIVDGSVVGQPTVAGIRSFFQTLSANIIRIQNHPLVIQDAVDAVSSPSDGAVSIFVGTTRQSFEGKNVVRLEYESYDQMTYKELHCICEKTRQLYAVDRIAILHRIGEVPVGEVSIVIATSAVGRRSALQATSSIIDEIKKMSPIFKKELYDDGTCNWKKNDRCNVPGH